MTIKDAERARCDRCNVVCNRCEIYDEDDHTPLHNMCLIQQYMQFFSDGQNRIIEVCEKCIDEIVESGIEVEKL